MMPIGYCGKPARTLIHFPIIHTEAEMGSLAASLKQVKEARFGKIRLAEFRAAVEQRWDEIECAVNALPLVPGKAKMYQDALPVCGCESVIVAELAAAGSRNHQILLRLLERGVEMVGTESAELLILEYKSALASAPVASGRAPVRAGPAGIPPKSLLERRDRFIGQRINETLGVGETGVLFLGVLHAVQEYLDPDIDVIWPLPSHRNPGEV